MFTKGIRKECGGFNPVDITRQIVAVNASAYDT